MAKPWGSRPSTNRCQNAGRSVRRVRSPDAPKITTACGSAGFKAIALLALLLGADGMAAELLAQRRDHFRRVRLVLPRREPREEGKRGDRSRDVLAHRREHRPPALPRILDVPPDRLESRILLERIHEELEEPGPHDAPIP